MLRKLMIAASIISILMTGAMLLAQPRPGPPPPANGLVAAQQEAADAIQRAYDAVGRSTVLAQNASQEIGDLLKSSRGAYQEALSRYQASDFAGARETAMASADLARAAEQAATANLIESATKQQIPAPPGPANTQTARTYQDLARVTDHVARLNNDLNARASVSVAAQVRTWMDQSREFERRAQTLLAANKPEQAGAMARAADALLAAADHLVRRAWIASGVAPPPPPGPKGPRPPPPRP